MLLVVHLILFCVFIALGIVFSLGKGAKLIAGYNTASPSEKAKYDEKKLWKGVGKLMFIIAGCWVVLAAGSVLKIMPLYWIGLCLVIFAVIGGIIYMNTGNRYRKS